AHGFRFSFTPLPGCFSPFPHGTGSLSVTREYLALGDGPPGFRRNFSCSAVLRIHSGENTLSSTGLLPSLADLSRSLLLKYSFVTPMECPTTPKSKLFGLGSFRFARRYLGNRVCFLFLRVLRCFSSPGMPHLSYVFRQVYCSITNSGFPHSEILGSQFTYNFPRHIGVSPVLRQLLVPRHPPCALLHLTSFIMKKVVLFGLMSLILLLFSFQGTKMEPSGIEPLTSCVQGRRSPS